MESHALLKSQELRMKFCKHRNSKLNVENRRAIMGQLKANGSVNLGGTPSMELMSRNLPLANRSQAIESMITEK